MNLSTLKPPQQQDELLCTYLQLSWYNKNNNNLIRIQVVKTQLQQLQHGIVFVDNQANKQQCGNHDRCRLEHILLKQAPQYPIPNFKQQYMYVIFHGNNKVLVLMYLKLFLDFILEFMNHFKSKSTKFSKSVTKYIKCAKGFPSTCRLLAELLHLSSDARTIASPCFNQKVTFLNNFHSYLSFKAEMCNPETFCKTDK